MVEDSTSMPFLSEISPLIGETESDREFIAIKESKRTLSYWELFAITVCFVGVQFGWAVQIAFSTPIFSTLGVPHFWLSAVWLAGPISGLIMQPAVGVLSDRSVHPWGRRRPFILFGAIFILVGMVLISSAADLGVWITGGPDPPHNGMAIGLAVLGFWILDLSNNTVQGPCRALLVDMAPDAQQSLGSTFFSAALGFGNLSAYLLGAVRLISYPAFGWMAKGDSVADIYRPMFVLSACTLIVSVSITLVVAKETPYKPEPGRPKPPNPFYTILKGVRTMKTPMARICTVQFVTWAGWFCYLLYSTAWVAEDVFGGNSIAPAGSESREKYDQGVRWGSLLNAGVTLAYTPCLPWLIRFFGYKPTYFFGQMVMGSCLVLTTIVKTPLAAVLQLGFLGIPWSTTMVIPFALIGKIAPVSESGLYVGVLNIFIVLPQLVVALVIPWIIRAFNSDLAAALGTGGICAFIGCIFVMRLIVVEDHEDEKDEETVGEEQEEEDGDVLYSDATPGDPLLKSAVRRTASGKTVDV